MKVEDLRELLNTIVKDPSLVMRPDGTTFCNFAVQRAAQAFGFHGFAGLMANEIYDHMVSSHDWLQVEAKQAADFAQRGGFAVAAQKEHAHGHVATLYPAPMGHSDSLGRDVPQVANVGKKNGVMRSSEAFPVSVTVGEVTLPNEASYFLWVGEPEER